MEAVYHCYMVLSTMHILNRQAPERLWLIFRFCRRFTNRCASIGFSNANVFPKTAENVILTARLRSAGAGCDRL